MNYIKTGLIISTIIIFISIIFLQYDVIGVNTIKDVLLIPAFIINTSLIIKLLNNKKTEK